MLEQIATIEICVVPEITNVRYLLGLFFIFLQCLVWIGTSVLTQYMFDETSFSSPFVMTYVGVALLSLLLPFNYLNERFSDRSSSPTLHSVNSEDSFAKELDNARAYGEILDVMTTRSVQHARTAKPWNHKKHILAALNVAPAMFISDYAYNKGLKYTSVTSCTVLVSTSCVFVLFFSVLLNLERFAISKLIGVLLAVLGTALTTFQDAQNDTEDMLRYSTKDTLLGDVFSLLAAVGYAAYSVQARLLCPENEELYSMTLLLGYVGLLTCIPLLPMAAYYMSDMELNFGMFKILILKGLLDFVITDYLLLKAVVLTNATIATVGLGLTIPMAFAADFFFQKADFTAMQYLGAFAVLLGFVLVNIMHTTELQCETNDTTVDDNVESGQDKPTESADPVIQTISSISATSEYPKV